MQIEIISMEDWNGSNEEGGVIRIYNEAPKTGELLPWVSKTTKEFIAL